MRIANARAASPLRPTPYTKSFFADVRIATASAISFERSTERIFARWSRRYAVDATAVVASVEVRVDVPAVGDLLHLRKHVVEVFRPLEQSEATRVHVREVQDRQDAFRVLDEGQEFVEAADDFGAAARLNPQPRADLAFLVCVSDEPQVLRDTVHRLFRLELAEHPEVRHDNRRPHRGELERSEEHTSELQSRLHLVCRLLLEKKKKNKE